MSVQISERRFEEAIECVLLAHGPDARAGDPSRVSETSPPYGETPSGGYLRRDPKEYDRKRCLLSRDVLDFIYATQPREWEKLKQHHGAEVKERFLARLAGEVTRRGVLDVLRRGIKDSGCKFRLAYFRPASALNAELQRLYEANLFAVVRQLRYSERNENSLDLVLFLNGLPLFTAELKNPFTGSWSPIVGSSTANCNAPCASSSRPPGWWRTSTPPPSSSSKPWKRGKPSSSPRCKNSR